MNITFCTIITTNYIHYALAIYHSLSKFEPDIVLHVFVADSDFEFEHVTENFPNIRILHFQDFVSDSYTQTISEKYRNEDMDCFRWSMKPIVIKHLLQDNYDQVFFLDPDLYFFHDFKFLYTELKNDSVLLTPHWRSSSPYKDLQNYSVLQTSGLFNAGFVGASKAGVPALEWWASVCAHECVKAPDRGLFVDQAYLDLLPVYYEGVKVLRHKGCNVANWNQIECERTLSKNGEVLINDEWKIIFIHFTKSTINGILSNQDYLLKPYLEKYQAALEHFSSWIPDEYTHSLNRGYIESSSNSHLTQKLSHSYMMAKKLVKRFVVR